MNEQDRDALESRDWSGAERVESYLRARLTHLDKLEKAIMWRELYRGRMHDSGKCWHALVSLNGGGRETHDGTPQGRGEALVRLWEKCTGGAT